MLVWELIKNVLCEEYSSEGEFQEELWGIYGILWPEGSGHYHVRIIQFRLCYFQSLCNSVTMSF